MLSIYSVDQSVKYWVALEMNLNSDVWRCHGYTTDHSFLPWKADRVFDDDKDCTFLVNANSVFLNDGCETEIFYLCESPPCPTGLNVYIIIPVLKF